MVAAWLFDGGFLGCFHNGSGFYALILPSEFDGANHSNIQK